MRVYSLETAEAWRWREVQFARIHFQSRHVTTLAFSPDDKLLAGGSPHNKVVIWQVDLQRRSWKVVGSPDDGQRPLRSLAWSPDGRQLVTCGSSVTVLGIVGDDIWSWKQVWRLPEVAGRDFYTVAFTPDGQWLAAAGSNATVYLWNVSGPVESWREQHALEGHTGRITRLAFSFRLTRMLMLVTASEDKTARVWDLTSSEPAHWREVKVFRGHRKKVVTAAFSPRGFHLATGSTDGSVRIWIMRSRNFSRWQLADAFSRGEKTHMPLGPVHDVAWSVENFLATSSGRYTTTASRIWDIKDVDLIDRRDRLLGPNYTRWGTSHLRSFMAAFHLYPHANSTARLCNVQLVTCTNVSRPCEPDVNLGAVDLDMRGYGSVDSDRLQCVGEWVPPIKRLHLRHLSNQDNSLFIPPVEELIVDSPEWGDSSGSSWLTSVLKYNARTIRWLDVSGTSFGGTLYAEDSQAVPFLEFLNLSGTQVEMMAAKWILGRTVAIHGTERLRIPGIHKLRFLDEPCDKLPGRPCFIYMGSGNVKVRLPPYSDGLLLMDVCEHGQEGPGLGSVCTPCSIGSWGGGLPCRPCGSHQTTLRSGSTSKDECLCFVGFLKQDDSLCHACPEGFDCMTIGTEMWTASVLPGYWRSSHSRSAVKCSCRERCIGGPPGRLCLNGHTGVKCDECLNGFFMASGGFCTRCFQSFRSWWPFLLVLLAGFVALLALALLHRFRQRRKPGAEPPNALDVAVQHLRDQVLALLNACQLMALISGAKNAMLQPGRNFNLLLFETREITDPLRPACWMSYHMSLKLNLLVTCAQPLLLCLAIQLAILSISSGASQRLSRSAKILPEALGMTLAGALASMSQIIECENEVPQGNKPWVRHLSFLECHGAEHTLFEAYAFGIMAIYAVITFLVFKLPAAFFTRLVEPMHSWNAQLRQEQQDWRTVTVFTCEMQLHEQSQQIRRSSLPVDHNFRVLRKVVSLSGVDKSASCSPEMLEAEAAAVASRICAIAALAVRGAVEIARLNQSGVENAQRFVTLRAGCPELRGPEWPSLVLPAGSSQVSRRPSSMTSERELSAIEVRRLETVMQERLLLIYFRLRELAPFASNVRILTKYQSHARHFDGILKVTAAGFAFAAVRQPYVGVILAFLVILQLFFQPWVLNEQKITALVTYGTIGGLFTLAQLDELNTNVPLILSKALMVLPFLRFLQTIIISAVPRLRRQSTQLCLEELVLSLEFQLQPMELRAVKELTAAADCVPSRGCPEDLWDPDARSTEAGAVKLESGTTVVPLLRSGTLLEVQVLGGPYHGLKGWLPMAVLRPSDSGGPREVELSWHKDASGSRESRNE